MDSQNNNTDIFGTDILKLPAGFEPEHEQFWANGGPHVRCGDHIDKDGLMKRVACGPCAVASYGYYRRLGYWEGRAAVLAEQHNNDRDI